MSKDIKVKSLSQYTKNRLSSYLVIFPIALGFQSQKCIAESGKLSETILKSDELSIEVKSDQSIGVGLVENIYSGTSLVSIKSVQESAKMSGLKSGMILVAVGNENVEGLPLRDVYERITSTERPFPMVFRDPNKLITLLSDPNVKIITTTILSPRTSKTKNEQVTIHYHI